MTSAEIAGTMLAQTSPAPDADGRPPAAASTNAAPEARDDCAITAEGAALGIPVLQNDRDADGDPLAVHSTTQPESGRVIVEAGGSVTFTPDAPGLQTFEYQASDGQGGTASATVTTFVNPADERLERPALAGAGNQELAEIARSCVAVTALDLVTLEGDQVQVAPPKPGQRVQIETEAGQQIALEGGEFARATYFVVDGGLLVLTEDGRSVFLSDFAEAARAEPATTLSVAGGPPVPAATLLANLQPVEVPTAPQTTVYRYELAGSGPAHGGGAGFAPYDPGALGPGLDPLGPLGPTELGPRPEFVLIDAGEVIGAADDEVSPPPPEPPPPPPPPPPEENLAPELSVTGQITVEVGEITDPVDPISAPPFPQLEEEQSVDLDLVNGVDQRNLTLGPSADATISFRNEFAAFQNTLGVYLIGPDGQIIAPRVVFAQVEHADALPGLLEVRPGGGPLSPGDPVRLSELYTAGELAPGTRFGLFNIAEGFELNGDLRGADLRFVNASGDPATIFDTEARLVAVQADGTLVPVGGDLYHTASPSADPLDNPFNTDGRGQVISGLEEGLAGLTITFEDLTLNRGDLDPDNDNDFNDVTFEVLLEPGTRPSEPFVKLKLALDADISDADDVELGGAAVRIASGFQPGDTLALTEPLAGTGVTLVEDGSNGSLVLDGDAPISTYVTLLRSLQLDPAGEGVRQLAFTVEDVRGAVSNPVLVRVNLTTAGAGAGDDADDNLIGRPGVNDFIAGRGGDDNLNGFSGNDTLDGGLGDDILNGGPGDDLLFGGPGSDTLIGGDGGDQHIFLSLADRGDRIEGFDANEGDTLDFSDLLQGAAAGTIDDFVSFTPSGSDVAVNVDADGSSGNFGSIPYLTMVNPTGIGTPQEAVDNGTVVVA